MKSERLGFPVSTRSGAVADLVLPTDPTARAAYFCHPDAPAVVLGSTQPESTLRPEEMARRGYSVVRRRSGGGAVRVTPGGQVWLDLFVPAEDPLFQRDVARASHFVGELWREALVALSDRGPEPVVHGGGVAPSRWSRSWCFSGLGPGEVTRAGRKLVGLSQRRNRDGAWFFTMARYDLDSGLDASMLSGSDADRDELRAELDAGGDALEWPIELVERELSRVLASR